jgi:hypothetical protein
VCTAWFHNTATSPSSYTGLGMCVYYHLSVVSIPKAFIIIIIIIIKRKRQVHKNLPNCLQQQNRHCYAQQNHPSKCTNGRSYYQQSQSSQHHYQEAPEVHRLERRVYKNVATDNGLRSSTSTVHNRFYSKQSECKIH